MSVLVKDVQANTHYVFVKGAPEKVRDLSVNKYPEFDDTVSKLSLAGLRSLAFGYKQVNNPSQIMSQSR
jgi:magnesium-transporting ATPase (P-type)